jgi:hypothetical protein
MSKLYDSSKLSKIDEYVNKAAEKELLSLDEVNVPLNHNEKLALRKRANLFFRQALKLDDPRGEWTGFNII